MATYIKLSATNSKAEIIEYCVSPGVTGSLSLRK